MTSRRHRLGQNRRSRNGKRCQGGRVVGLGSTAGAFVALGLIPLATAPSAHADLEDLFQPVIDSIAQAINVVDPGLASSLDPGLDVGSVAAAAVPADAAENATIPLTMYNTAPLVDISVGGGLNIPVEVDTGSEGVVVPWYDVGLQNLVNVLHSHPTVETTGYGGSPADPNIKILYIEDPDTTVNFGSDIVTSPTTVDLELFAYPASNSNLFNLEDWSFQAYEHANHADGLLGIGNGEAGEVGPGPSSPITALPGDLNEGVLINETGGYLEFGPNPLTPYASVIGAPVTNELEVSVGGGGSVPLDLATIDSGGGYGTMPVSILNNAPAVGDPLSPGTEISVSTSGGQFLYSYFTTATNSPIVSSDTTMNTGSETFQLFPVYLSYTPAGFGTTVFDYDY
jgi:hypothetical protein